MYDLNRQGFLKDWFCEVRKNEEFILDFAWVVGVILDMRKLGEEVLLDLESEINVFVSGKF